MPRKNPNDKYKKWVLEHTTAEYIMFFYALVEALGSMQMMARMSNEDTATAMHSILIAMMLQSGCSAEKAKEFLVFAVDGVYASGGAPYRLSNQGAEGKALIPKTGLPPRGEMN